jgi:hypothetical protein
MRRRGIATLVVAVLLVGASATWQAWTGRRTVIVPDRVQLTTTGNTRLPALSPDGRRFAYLLSRCEAGSPCTRDAVIRDVGGLASATLARDWLTVFSMRWTNDGRYLLMTGVRDSTAGLAVYAIPTLGGEPRRLGCCAATSVGNGDTLLLTDGFRPDSVHWIRAMTVADGVISDSIAVRRRQVEVPYLFARLPMAGALASG